MTAWFSLRRRLLALLLGGVSVCWLATLGLSYVDAHHEIDELLDAQLVQVGQTLLVLAAEADDEDDIADEGRIGHKYQKRLRFQVWTRDGELLLRSRDAPKTPLATADGFSESVEPDGRQGRWRYYSQWNDKRSLRVQVGESHHVRDELTGHIAWRLLVPALFGLPLLGGWIWLATRRGLAPLGEVAADIAGREPTRLQALTPASAPQEIRPLVEAINGLFGRVEAALEAERRFTADAAHELRTPLAALAAQAQVAARARDDAERGHALEQLAAGTRRAARLVDQLLTLARIDVQRAEVPTNPVALDRLAEEVCADHGTAALAKNLVLELDAMPTTVAGDADLLRILLRNLVDNAIRYTPAGGRIAVVVGTDASGTLLSVADSGPGIPENEREHMFERFSRLAGQDIEGSGLGLSIVRRIAELHGARLTLESAPEGGLRASLRFA